MGWLWRRIGFRGRRGRCGLVQVALRNLNVVLLEQSGKLAVFRLKFGDLLPQCFDDQTVCVAVHHRFVLDVAGATRVLDCLKGLHVVAVRMGGTSDHCRATVATQTVLQNARELTVAVRDERLASGNLLFVGQGADNIY